MQKERLDYLDFAKCIAIFLVIWGHAAPTGSSIPYRIVLYAFHMPLFFLVSGMVIARRADEYDSAHWKKFLKKNVMALLVPYLIWGAIYSSFGYGNLIKLFYGSWEMIEKAETLTSLWYLPCLFLARMMAELLLMLSWRIRRIPRWQMALAASAAAFAVGFALPHLSIGDPLCCDIAFVALGFIMLGYAVKNLVFRLPRRNGWLYLLTAALFGGLLFLGQRLQGNSPQLMMMCRAEYGNLFFFFLNAFAGIGLVLSFSMFLTIFFRERPHERARAFMLWAGENTIGIYFLHKPFLQEVIMPALLSATGTEQLNAGLAFAGAIGAFVFSAAGCWAINRYVPSLFGKSAVRAH